MIISGGQTGVDRAALDVAIAMGITHGGWCPRGRIASDGHIDARYQLLETASHGYRQRTKANVLTADATLIIGAAIGAGSSEFHDGNNAGSLTGGSALTLRLVKQHQRPHFVVQRNKDDQTFGALKMFAEQIHQWLQCVRPTCLNVAGSSEVHHPDIYEFAFQLLSDALDHPERNCELP